MSLNADQRKRTTHELAENAALSGLTRAELIGRCGLTSPRFDSALRVGGANPADVWLLRDVLETAVRDAGRTPVAYSVLTEAMRSAAGAWFGVADNR